MGIGYSCGEEVKKMMACLITKEEEKVIIEAL